MPDRRTAASSPGSRPRSIRIRATPGDRVAVRFDYAADLIARIREIPGRRWHERARCWTVPADPASLGLLLSRLRGEDLRIDAEVERLLPRRGLEGVGWKRLPGARSSGARHRLSAARAATLDRLREELTLRGYSPRTRKVYLNQARRFLKDADVSPSELRVAHVRSYIRGLHERGLSHSYADQNASALRFLFDRVLGRPIPPDELPRPRRQRRLPVVLSRDEMRRLFGAVENPKHLAILMLVYAGGLRVGEIVRLRIADVDVGRGLIHVRQGKGRKDRCVPLSRVALVALRRYLRRQPAPGPWLFPGQKPGRHLTTRTVQHVFAAARERAGIDKPATPHTLRHSYATHLHEDGVGLRYIQTLLGHKSPKTTEIYTHVSRADLARIPSPLDRLMGAGEGSDDPLPDDERRRP